MPDIQDLLVKSIQNYARSIDAFAEDQIAIMALAEDMAAFMAEDMNFVQEWAVGTLVPRDGDELLDDIDDEDFDRDRALRSLKKQSLTNGFERRALVTRMYMEWVEDTEPALDAELVELVQKDQ